MSTSDTKKYRIIYIASILFVFLFGVIYEIFSHNVYSIFMVGAFVVPLCGYILTELFIALSKKFDLNNNIHFQLLGGATVWLTLGSIFKGVLDIYGTTNHKMKFFLIIGLALLIAAITYIIMAIVFDKKGPRN